MHRVLLDACEPCSFHVHGAAGGQQAGCAGAHGLGQTQRTIRLKRLVLRILCLRSRQHRRAPMRQRGPCTGRLVQCSARDGKGVASCLAALHGDFDRLASQIHIALRALGFAGQACFQTQFRQRQHPPFQRRAACGQKREGQAGGDGKVGTHGPIMGMWRRATAPVRRSRQTWEPMGPSAALTPVGRQMSHNHSLSVFF